MFFSRNFQIHRRDLSWSSLTALLKLFQVNSLVPSRSNRSSCGSKSDYNDIGYNRGAQSGYNTASSGGYDHGAGSKRKSHYQKSTYQKSNYRSDGRTEKYHSADRKVNRVRHHRE